MTTVGLSTTCSRKFATSGDVILQAIGSRNAPGETMSSQIQTIHLKGGGQLLKQRPPLLPSAVPSMQIQKRLARDRPLRVIEFDRAGVKALLAQFSFLHHASSLFSQNPQTIRM